jgi:rhamnose utilization protein RhaD (predicted bifunctional aldolase and dehydrogenase)
MTETSGPYRQIVSEHDVGRALDWLRDNAPHIGMACERKVKADKMLSHIEALLIRDSEATSDEKRKADARASKRYEDAILEAAEAAGEYEKMKALREAAALKCEIWRSEQANYRSMKI